MLNQIQNDIVYSASFALVIVTVVVFILAAALPFFINKGINSGAYIKTVNDAVDKAGVVMDAADKILPGNAAINTLKLIENWAQKGVHGAEQLYIASQLHPDKRKEKAEETIYAALELANINTTPELKKIVDGAIEAEVLALGHVKTAQENSSEND